MSRIILVNQAVSPSPPPAGKLALFARNDGIWFTDDLGNEVHMFQPPAVGAVIPTRHGVGQILGTGVGLVPAPIAIPIVLPVTIPAAPVPVGGIAPAPQGQLIGAVSQNCTTALEPIKIDMNFHYVEQNNGRENMYVLIYRNGELIDLAISLCVRRGLDDMFNYSFIDNPPATGINLYEVRVACDVINGGSAIDINNPVSPFSALPPVTEIHAYPLGGF